MISLKKPITTSQDLSDAVLNYTTSIGRRFKLESISIHFSVAVTETITITRDSAQGANYDTVLRKTTLSAQQDFIFRPDGEENEYVGDEVKIYITNANGTGIAYVEIKASAILQ